MIRTLVAGVLAAAAILATSTPADARPVPPRTPCHPTAGCTRWTPETAPRAMPGRWGR